MTHPEPAVLRGCCCYCCSVVVIVLVVANWNTVDAAGRRLDIVGLDDMTARAYLPENALMPGIHRRGLVPPLVAAELVLRSVTTGESSVLCVF